MNNLEKYNNVFVEIFGIDENELNNEFTSEQIEEWDSIGHMNLLSAIEETFDITLEDEDLLQFTSYEAGKEIIKKYGIEIN
ncbi:MAG: acyl carrier protein [Lachnospiraceae bacterium]|nr:acyl carrier protein [Lachnospiraceae bacterium]